MLLEEGFAMTSAFSWQSSVSLCPASLCTPRSKLPVNSRYLLTSYLCILVPYDEKDIFLLVLVLDGLVGLHKTVQLQLLQHSWLRHRLGLLLNTIASLRNEQRSLCCLETAPKYTQAFWTLVDYEGYSISSKEFLPTVVDIMVI